MCVRGGYPSADNKRNADAPKLNWTRDVFTRLANHTDTHKATSVGHDLITHYQNYLVEYETEHPEDTSVPETGDEPREYERCEPKQVGKLPEGAGGGAGGDRGGAAGNGGRARARRGPGRPRGSGRGRGAGRSRARVPRVKRRAASDFQIGCRVKVFWRAMDEWYSGVIEEQESSEGADPGAEGGVDGAPPPEPVVLSKVVYDDGDVEVLDLVGGVEKVVLLTYVDGAATSDAELEPIFEEEDDDDDDDEDDTRRGRRGGSRRSNRGAAVGRRTLAKDDNQPQRAPGSGPSAKELRRRNPARATARANDDGDEIGDPDDARVRAVLDTLTGNEAAKSLAELAVDAEPPEEVFRLGYKMGARRAIACCAAVVAASAARAGPVRGNAAAKRTAKQQHQTIEIDVVKEGATPEPLVGAGREKRVRKKNSKYDDDDEIEDKSAKKPKKRDEPNGKDGPNDTTHPPADSKPAKAGAKSGSKSKSKSPDDENEDERLKTAALELELATLRDELDELKREKAIREEGERRGEKLRRDAAVEGGAWDDPIDSASTDPALTRVLAALEDVLAKEVFDPNLGADETDDDVYDGEDTLDLVQCDPAAAAGIDTDAIRGVLDVDASTERWRAERGFNPNAANTNANTDAIDAMVNQALAKPEQLTAAVALPPAASLVPPAVVHSPADIVAAAYEEARNKRAAADEALASILDPVKLAQVQADASNGKPTTTVGRLIKAANNAATRAERIAAGGGGDGRALRVPGIRRAGPGRPPGSGRGRPPGSSSGPVRPKTRPSEAELMERSGPGVDDYEFRPPLAQSARKAAAKAFEAAKPDLPEGAAKRGRPRKEKANKEANTNDETAGREDETAGVAEWADGDRVIDGDKKTTEWLTARGWGEYAAAFAAKGLKLGGGAGRTEVSMQDMEDIVTDDPVVRVKIYDAIEARNAAMGREVKSPRQAKRSRGS